MQENRFDTLARSLAQGTSRRSALKLLGAFIGGSLLSSLGHERMGAQDNSDAAHFCQALPPGPARRQCVSDAAHGTGLFVECQGDITRLCQGKGTCCAPGLVCVAAGLCVQCSGPDFLVCTGTGGTHCCHGAEFFCDPRGTGTCCTAATCP